MSADLSPFQQLFTQFQALHIKERKGATFLEIARFPHRETVWSNILAFYLDPNREHGLHDLLLKSLFEAIGQDVTGLLTSLHTIRVQTEIITSKGNRLDLMVSGGKFVLGIENKVEASLYNDLADYGATLDSHAGGAQVYKVVLSRYPVVANNHFVNVTYAQLVQVVRTNLGNYTDYADSKYLLFLLDFLKTIEKHHNPSSFMENPDVLNLLRQNTAAVEELVKHHNAFRSELVSKMDRVDKLLVSRLYAAEGLASQVKSAGGKLRGEGPSNVSGRFTWNSHALLKFCVSVGDLSAFYQVGVVKEYRLRAHYWVNGNQPAERRLATAGVQELYFALEDTDEQIAQTMEAQLQKIVTCLTEIPLITESISANQE